MKAMRSFLIGIFGLTIGITTSILVMTKGWGVEPKSWFWIVGVSLFGHLFAQVIIEAAKSGDK